MAASIKERVKTIQRKLGVRADGIIGPVTLSKIEEKLGISNDDYSLMVSRKGINALIGFEISSQRYYSKALAKPIWPGGSSGATIGIGYDLGYTTASVVETDWGGLVSASTLEHLKSLAGKKGQTAKGHLGRLSRARMKIPYRAAEEVFYNKTLPKYARQVRKIYPGVEHLPADAQAILLSLVYNRGASLSGSRRKEMKAICALVRKKDINGIADQFVAMKRLWVGKGLDGLLQRRDKEARMIKSSRRRYRSGELVYL